MSNTSNNHLDAQASSSESTLDDLLASPPIIINAGLESFALELQAAGHTVVQLDWRPPADGDPKLAAILSKLGS